MEAFESLRKQASQKRDAIIRAARAEFAQTMKHIRALECDLGASARRQPRPKPRPMMELVATLAPKDRTFTFNEVVELLNKAEPWRLFSVPTLRTVFQKLELKGTLRRVRRVRQADGNVLWARADCKLPDSPYGAMRLPDVAAAVLRETGPKRMIELFLEIRQRGYRPDADQKKLRNSLAQALKRHPQRFTNTGGKWALV